MVTGEALIAYRALLSATRRSFPTSLGSWKKRVRRLNSYPP
ncbi:unnamed protein product [Brassica oleracea]